MSEAKTPINYIEFKAKDLTEIKNFYSKAFGWVFTDYGDGYTAFAESGIEGGFELSHNPIINGALVVLHHDSLIEVKKRIIASGGTISQDIFSFPGGSRFHFLDPSGNELAVWCEE
ncbi:VOC family protein [uncultured Croceitalea sp.]|uniref:VOC family protein n=1 Tax=uncultured Croceitalea sp. TaxID=1798908 RepID=UPI0033056F9C